MPILPNVVQTRRSTEPDAGVLNHDNEELMDTSSRQDINDADDVTFSSEKDTLLMDLNVRSRQRNRSLKNPRIFK